MLGRSGRVRTRAISSRIDCIRSRKRIALRGRSTILHDRISPSSSRQRKRADRKSPLAPFAKTIKPKKVDLASSSSGSVVKREQHQKMTEFHENE